MVGERLPSRAPAGWAATLMKSRLRRLARLPRSVLHETGDRSAQSCRRRRAGDAAN
jgi:hypothetical protein